jgi:hypothetical protein
MLLTAFTPTHKLDHIRETAISLAAQSVLAHGHEIEWVIGYNNGLTEADVLAAIGEMPAGIHVRFPEIDRTTTLIGQLKRELCLAAQGDVLIELDHDDILAANAFERLLEVLGDRDTAFIYSDSASFDNETLKPYAFDPEYGWEADVGIGNAPNTRLHGQQIVGMRAQAPSARALCQILYAPDHFRAWTRKAYLLAGGHDAQLPVDGELNLVQSPLLHVHAGSPGDELEIGHAQSAPLAEALTDAGYRDISQESDYNNRNRFLFAVYG